MIMTTDKTSIAEPTLRRVTMTICDACIDGLGKECHTHGCALWLHRVDLPIHRELIEIDAVETRDVRIAALEAERDHATKIAQEENAKALVAYEERRQASDRALDLEQRLAEAIRHRAETNEEIKKLHGVINAGCFSVEDSVSLYETRKALKELLERDQVLAAALVEWTDFDVAEIALGKVLGVVPPVIDASWMLKYKFVFWSANNVGDGLSDILHTLVKIGRIEKDDGIRFRWCADFDLDAEAQKDEG